MRRAFCFWIACCLAALTAAPAMAMPSAGAVLRSAFESYWGGGNANFYGTVVHHGSGYFHAATGLIDFGTGATRISPVFDDVYCSGDVFGIWVILGAASKSELEGMTWEMALGPSGAPPSTLSTTSTAPRRFVDPQGSLADGGLVWWRSVGVPVYGTLSPGEYDLVSQSNVFGTFEVTVTVESC